MYQKLPTYELPENYADLPEDTQREWDAFHRGYELIHTMLNECIKDMLAVGIPIQNNKIIDCGLARTPHAHAVCCFDDTTGELRYIICVNDRVVKYLDDAEVMANVKNSVYHELVHTIQGATTHNEIFRKWAQLCDAALGTRTMYAINTSVFYHTSKTKKPLTYVCPHCGLGYITTRPGKYMCYECGNTMERQ